MSPTTTPSIFQYENYIDYLKHHFGQNKKDHGKKADFCRALKMQGPYLSKILGDKAHLSLEQADLANHFFNHDGLDSKMFLLKVQWARAGSYSLREFLKEQILELGKRQFNLQEKFKLTEVLSESENQVYFSSRYYGLIHLLVGIPEMGTPSALGKALGLNPADLNPYLEFLSGCGLLTKIETSEKEPSYRVGKTRLHLGQGSPSLSQYHTMWRIEAIRSFQTKTIKKQLPPLHYTSIMAVSKKDAQLMREKLTNWIKEHEATVAHSKEEKTVALCISYFDI